MKKFSVILLCVLMIAAILPAAVNAAVDETYVRSGDNGDVTVVYVKDAAVTIDGNITDKEWSAATKIPLNGTTTMKTWGLGVFSGTMDFRTAWGENGLYVSAVIYDDRIADGAANEGSLSTRFQIALNPAGIICDPWSGLFFSFTPVAGSSDVALMKHFWESSSDNGTWVKAEEGYTGKYTLIKSGDKTVGWNLEAVIPWALISTADRQTGLDENDETPLTTFSPKAEDRSKAFCNAMICYVQCSTRDGNVISTARTCKNGNPDAWEAGSYDINLKFKKNVVPGDINKDGSANNKDVVALFRYVSSGKGNVDELACDCNGDGHKNNKDVVTLFRYVSSGKVTIYYNGAPVLPDKQLTYTSAKIYADEETAKANKNECEPPTRTDLANWFIGQANYDEVTFEIIIPEEMAYLESYVVRSAIGKYIEEVNVLKVNDPTKLDAVKAMVEGHAKRQNDNQDYSLYNDDGRNGKMIGTGKVAVYGNFVVYACTLDSSLSVLRAQKYVAENPDATAFDVYRAVVCELYE